MSRSVPREPEPPWVKFYMHVWDELTADLAGPTWLRIFLVTAARHRANRHATFQPGELARLVGKVDSDGGLLPEKNVGREIQRAVEKGYLDPSSGPRCTVMRKDFVSGPLGDSDARCSVHERGR